MIFRRFWIGIFWAIWTICIPNESWEHSEFKFDMKKYNLLWKIWRKSNFFLISPHFWWDCFFRIENFSKKFIYTPHFFFHQLVQNKLKDKVMKFDTPTFITHRMTIDWMSGGLIQPPPGLFRVKTELLWADHSPSAQF